MGSEGAGSCIIVHFYTRSVRRQSRGREPFGCYLVIIVSSRLISISLSTRSHRRSKSRFQLALALEPPRARQFPLSSCVCSARHNRTLSPWPPVYMLARSPTHKDSAVAVVSRRPHRSPLDATRPPTSITAEEHDPLPSPLSLSARRTHFLLFATPADNHTGLCTLDLCAVPWTVDR